MRKKTLEELRASNRERQRRWREGHLGFARTKERNAKRIMAGTMEALDKPIPNGIPNKSVFIPNAIPAYGELHLGEVEGVDVPYERERGACESSGPAIQRGIVEEVGGRLREGAVTEEEEKTYKRLKELKERQALGRLNAGVEVELDI